MFTWSIDSILSGKFYQIWKTEGLIKTIERGKAMKYRNIHDNAGARGVVPMVGMDIHGNRYYEDIYADDSNTSGTSTRWMEFSDRWEWSFSGRKVPAEWHGWLHKIHDDAPTPGNPHYFNPIFKVRHEGNKSGLPEMYFPLGHHTSEHKAQFVAN
jgi:NADH:ubiquinone oxidoreductase subunit